MVVPIVQEEAWLPVIASLPTWQPPARHTVVIAPHPDDETLGAGGLIVSLRQRGCEVTVVAVTDGENCYPGEDLGQVRPAEQAAALAELGVDERHVRRLHLPDSGLSQCEEALYNALLKYVPEEAHLVAPWTGDFHPDHEVCGRAALRVAKSKGLRLTSYFFWTWHRGTPELIASLPLVKLPLTPDLQTAKREALLCHTSQLQHHDDEPILPGYLLEPAWRDAEVFLPAWDPARTSSEFFEAKYRADADPWNFASSASELARYDAVVAALGNRRFRHGLEPACSVGVLTRRLAPMCARLDAFDLSPTAAARAAERCADLPHVTVHSASLLDLVPDPTVDLLILSEIGYYFTTEHWTRILDHLVGSLNAGCTVVGVHWLGISEDHITEGDEVHATLRANGKLRLLHEERHDTFRLDLFEVMPA